MVYLITTYRAVINITHLNSMCLCIPTACIAVMVDITAIYRVLVDGIFHLSFEVYSIAKVLDLKIFYREVIISLIIYPRPLIRNTRTNKKTIQCIPIPIHCYIVSTYDQAVSLFTFKIAIKCAAFVHYIPTAKYL